MATMHVRGMDMHYLTDDYTEPWSEAETILMLHGNSESSAVWFGWVPELAPEYRIVRPDMRGFGASTPMPRDFPWTLDAIIERGSSAHTQLQVYREQRQHGATRTHALKHVVDWLLETTVPGA